jgi:hypothetical protein
MARGRSVGFLVVWLVVWTAAILTAVWYMGAAALRGEPGAAVFLLVWLGAAGFGFWNAARKLVRLLTVGEEPRRPLRHHEWDDGIEPPPR